MGIVGRNGRRVVAIHQPDFFPWLGFFDKLFRCDCFIILDDVQFPKTGGTYCNRVKLLVGGNEQWVTAPVVRSYEGFRRIDEMQYQSEVPWREKILRTISMNYRRAEFFKETMGVLESIISNPENSLASYNVNAIVALSDKFEIPRSKFFWSSKLPHDGTSTELLVSLTRAVGGDCYLCGSGALGYQNDAMFDAAKIQVIHRQYRHPVYPQPSSPQFIEGLSIVDSLMHCGLSAVRSMLYSGIEH
jgi:hypothetical protein